jgi:large subunit ribosomal protein L21
MYAVVETGGKQYRVQPGDTLDVELLDAEQGSTIKLGRVLMLGGDGDAVIGQPVVPGARVLAEVVGQVKGDKIIVFKYKSKVRYRRKTGHRQKFTRVRITEIQREASDGA